MLARAGGPLLASVVWTLSGGYDAVLWTLLGFGVAAVAALLVLMESSPPE